MSDNRIAKALMDNLPLKVYKAYGHSEDAVKALREIAVSLNDMYRYFEPGFFAGNFFVIKHFTDQVVLDESKGIPIYHDKNILLNKSAGVLIVQIFSDGKILLWENEDVTPLLKKDTSLIYHFHSNTEKLLANQDEINITYYAFGSQYAPQYINLIEALHQYATHKIYNSSCPHFTQSWFDSNRLFLKGGGSGSNIPEKHMQESLHEFLSVYFSRGISIDPIREYNVGGGQPKPVDVKIHWKEANRAALIEIKFLGTVKGKRGKITVTHDNHRANVGITQLKGYHDKHAGDLPTTILKSFLVVIDGRRNNLVKSTKTISIQDGMYYKDRPIEIDDDKKFHESNPTFAKPVKMFATPICS